MRRFVIFFSAWSVLPIALAITGCAGTSNSPPPRSPEPTRAPVTLQTGIITPDGNTTEAELAQRAEHALARQEWQQAADDYELLLKAVPNGPSTATYLFSAGLAYEGLEQREKARDRYHELAQRFPDSANARTAIVREMAMDAYLEEWKALGEVSEALLARKDIDEVDRMLGLGGRALSKIELGGEPSRAQPAAQELQAEKQADAARAEHDILDGLDIADRTHYGAPDRLPVAVAQLRFAFGELKRVRAERITFVPLPADFLGAIEARCGGLLKAQEEYALAVRSIDPHWGTMAGYRVSEMYRQLHHDLMQIPAPDTVKTERQKQLFFGFMHVRYRVLLEKALRQLDETVTFGKRNNDTSVWLKRAEKAKAEIELAISEERAQIAKFPFTEDEMKAAIEYLQKQALAKDAKSAQPPKNK